MCDVCQLYMAWVMCFTKCKSLDFKDRQRQKKGGMGYLLRVPKFTQETGENETAYIMDRKCCPSSF